MAHQPSAAVKCGLEHCDIWIRTIAMPSDTNPHGHIFGGWLMSQMDLAGGTCAHYRAQGPVATVGVDSMAFHQPVFVGDQLTCYADIVRVGRTSITVKVEAWVKRMSDASEVKVTEGTFTFVAVDGHQRPRVVPPLP